ncbi:MAG: hypothetical protein JXL81_05615, partial [Deltaproteobacteria bacterium]|nr:hypothetical protein [Deltaproteobacteria bacterium]
MTNQTKFPAKLKKLLLLLLVISSLTMPGACKQSYAENKEAAKAGLSLPAPTKEHAKTTRALVKKLQRSHYIDEPFNDSFSEKVFDTYIKILDPARAHFLGSDIQEFSKYRHTLDEDLKEGNLEPAFFIYSRYDLRRKQRLNYMLELLNKGIDSFDFNKNEYLELDRENSPWHADMNEAKDLWRRLLKNDILNLKLQEKPAEN